MTRITVLQISSAILGFQQPDSERPGRLGHRLHPKLFIHPDALSGET
jgi:hypothetical protein